MAHHIGMCRVPVVLALILSLPIPVGAAPFSVEQVRQILATPGYENADAFAGKDLSRLDLSGLVFKGANLEGANLFAAKLVQADFSGANLARANLNGAWLMGTDFSKASLSGASLMSVVILGGAVKTRPNF